jgi:hypothetical protein
MGRSVCLVSLRSACSRQTESGGWREKRREEKENKGERAMRLQHRPGGRANEAGAGGGRREGDNRATRKEQAPEEGRRGGGRREGRRAEGKRRERERERERKRERGGRDEHREAPRRARGEVPATPKRINE